MSDIKQTVLSSLEDVGYSFGELAKSHRAAQDAISNYFAALSQPAIFQVGPIFALPAEAGPAPKAGDQKRGRGPNKVKKEKDPNAPKRPPSAYLEYQNSVRQEFRERYPNDSYAEVLRKIGQLWRAMTDEQKKPWIDQYQDKQAEYKEEQKTYAVEHPAQPVASTSGSGGGGAGAGETKNLGTGKKRGRKSKKEKEALSALAEQEQEEGEGQGQGQGQDIIVGDPPVEDDESDEDDTSSEASPRSRPSKQSPLHKDHKGDKHKVKKSKSMA
ncbi:hypothetical protein JCM1840_000696 [Sporobolomyces johnsonii]